MPSPEFPESKTNANCSPYSVTFGPSSVGSFTSRTAVSGSNTQPLPAGRGPSPGTRGVSKPEFATGRHGSSVVDVVVDVEVVLEVDDVDDVDVVDVIVVVDEVDDVEVVVVVVVVVLQREAELALTNLKSTTSKLT